MSSLRTIEKQSFERLLGMSSGYILDFSNSSFQEFMHEVVDIDIYTDKYAEFGESKAKRLRAFWKKEPDSQVGKVLAELIEYWTGMNPLPKDADIILVGECRKIVERLLGKQVRPEDAERLFLNKDLGEIRLSKATRDVALLPILESRYAEASRCLDVNAPLATIFLCGSMLEGLLLGAACANPKQFNAAPNSPKDGTGKVKHFHDWKLADFIDVACEIGVLKLDIKKFGHALRDFRNFIHPYQQMSARFNPDRHTAEICLQVLKAAVASLSGERS